MRVERAIGLTWVESNGLWINVLRHWQSKFETLEVINYVAVMSLEVVMIRARPILIFDPIPIKPVTSTFADNRDILKKIWHLNIHSVAVIDYISPATYHDAVLL